MWKRVVAPALVVSILWIAVSAITTYHVGSLLESHSRAMSENVATIEASWAMRRDTWKLQVAILEPADADPESSRIEISNLEATFQKSLAEAARTSLTEEEQQLISMIRQRFGVYQDHIEQQLRAREDGEAPTTAGTEQSVTLAEGVTEACRKLIDLNQRLIEQETAANERLYLMILVYRVGFLVVGPLVGLLLGVWIARRLSRSISQISVTLHNASGGLGCGLGSVAVSESGELPTLSRQVDAVADRIRHVLGELEDARRRVVQSERLAAVGELAAGVAHEIRNPLTSVKLLIQTASRRDGSAGLSAQHFDVLLREISRMEATVQGLLDFARPPRLQVACHDLRQTIRRALNLIQLRAQQQGIAIVEDFPAKPVLVDADPEQLHSVFLNLAINACEAMPEGGALHISIQPEGELCRIQFRDTGSGISLQILDRIFEPFVTSKERGTGLGLAISRRIIEEHGGSLRAANSAEGGAILTVELQLGGRAAIETRPGVANGYDRFLSRPRPTARGN